MFLLPLAASLASADVAPRDWAAAPPAPWFYGDLDGSIDWDGVRVEAGEPLFRTVGYGLQSEPVAVDARPWACGAATRVIVGYEAGMLTWVRTWPYNACVEDAVPLLAPADLRDLAHALLVLDVPAAVR